MKENKSNFSFKMYISPRRVSYRRYGSAVSPVSSLSIRTKCDLVSIDMFSCNRVNFFIWCLKKWNNYLLDFIKNGI